MTPFLFLIIIGLAIAAQTGVSLWLLARHLRHVGAHRGEVPSAFAPQVSLAHHQRAADYVAAKGSLGRAEMLVGLIPTLWLIFGGGLAGLWSHTAQLSIHPILREVSMVVLTSLIGALFSLPFDWQRTFGVEAQFGFNKMTAKLWLADLLKQTLMGALIMLPFAAFIFWLLRATGDTWWLWAWIAFMTLQLTLLAIYPRFIAPLFNRFTPLADGEAKSAIEGLLTRTGFASGGLFVMDGSKRSAHGNAYFTGFGKTKRIVFYDTLLEKLSVPQIVAVLAHELGHFKRKHILKRLVVFACVSLGFLALSAWALKQPWFAQAFAIPAAQFSAAPGLALIAFSLVVGPLFFWLTPLSAAYSRKHEFEADAFAAATADKQDLIAALAGMYSDNASTLTPDPLYSAYYDSHPPAPIRVGRLRAMAAA
jgi:STE24 endopeptidase